MKPDKPVVYQIFTRLFGNKKNINQPWGTLGENGTGRFSDINEAALCEIRKLGATHVWYTGVIHHATTEDFTRYGISNDNPHVVKGRAGSPYAIKDYYQVDPTLADKPEKRLEEFEELIVRTHAAGLKVIIDIVPNHVAREYCSRNRPEGVSDFGAHDDTDMEYRRDNNFYYIPGHSFKLPEFPDTYLPLGGVESPSLQPYHEYPAKWTGNGARKSQPGFSDWYETIRLNFGVKPDGSHDFPQLPMSFDQKSCATHYDFWKDHSVPDTWIKLRQIAEFWLNKGVDGFRYDVAELVPVEFWSYMNSAIKKIKPNAFLLAEIYQPDLYRDFIYRGKMDYLYNKVGLYDTLRLVIEGKSGVGSLLAVQQEQADIEQHMLNFLENHDEQRIASPDFAGNAEKAKPAILYSVTSGTSASMIYFGQEVGEPGAEHAGFGQPSRTSIFDYIGVPSHQRWMNGGSFDGGRLSSSEQELRGFYSAVLNYSRTSHALKGDYIDLYSPLSEQLGEMQEKVFLFARKRQGSLAIVILNFDAEREYELDVRFGPALMRQMGLSDGPALFRDQILKEATFEINVSQGAGKARKNLAPLSAFAFETI